MEKNFVPTKANHNAFASPLPEGTRYADVNNYDGLTKREYFAAMAMQGMLANDWAKYREQDEECTLLTTAAVNYADALIESLNKPKQ